MDHKYYMQRALELAKQGQGAVHPNPMVGAVIVKDNRIIGEGYHQRYGSAHAEIEAFHNATEDVSGATMYVTLEPCSHFGKTPPCADAIIANGIKQVVIAMQDPNPLVSGQGIQKLKDAGVAVQTGVLKKQAKELNERFLHFIKTKRPYVIVKTAMSKNRKITSANGRWVTGEASRTMVHQLRALTKAVLVGVQTVIDDDPMLNVRHIESPTQPLRVVLDSRGRTPHSAKLVQTAKQMPTWIYVNEGVDAQWTSNMQQLGVRVIELSSSTKRVSLEAVFKHLGEAEIDEVLIEPGRRLLQSLINEKWINQWWVFESPNVEGDDQLDFLAYDYKINSHFQLLREEQVGEDTLRVFTPKEV